MLKTNDPFKSSIVTCKRLGNILKEWEYGEKSHLRQDASQVADAITNLLTKLETKQHVDSVKRLHLAPEQLYKTIVQIENGNSSGIAQALKMIQAIVSDIELLKQEQTVPKRPALPARNPSRKEYTSLEIKSPNAHSLFSEIDKALDFALPDFATDSLFHANSASNSSTSTIGDMPPSKLQQAMVEKPRKVIIKSVSTKPSINPLASKPVVPNPVVQVDKTVVTPVRETVKQPQPRQLPQTPSAPTEPKEFEILISYGPKTLKRSFERNGSLSDLYLLFEKTFSIKNTELYINHAITGQEYLLETITDVYPGCFVVAREVPKPTPNLEMIQSITEPINDQFKKLETIDSKLDDLKRLLKPRPVSDKQFVQSCQAQLQELDDLRTNLKLFKSDVTMQLEETRLFFDSQLELFRSLISTQPEQAKEHPKEQQETNEIDTCKQQCEELNEKVKDFAAVLESTRIDLTRGCRPSSHLHDRLVQLQKTLEKQVTKQKQSFNLLKTNRKQEWEKTLQSILKEQKSVGESWQQMEEIQSMLDDASQLSESILPILVHQRKHKLPSKPVALQVWDPEEINEFGREQLLQELKTIDEVGRPEVDIIVEAQKRMRIPSPNPFEQELVEFTDNNAFKRKVGVDKVDEARKQKDLQVIKTLWSE
jgi:hypothetical protein